MSQSSYLEHQWLAEKEDYRARLISEQDGLSGLIARLDEGSRLKAQFVAKIERLNDQLVELDHEMKEIAAALNSTNSA